MMHLHFLNCVQHALSTSTALLTPSLSLKLSCYNLCYTWLNTYIPPFPYLKKNAMLLCDYWKKAISLSVLGIRAALRQSANTWHMVVVKFSLISSCFVRSIVCRIISELLFHTMTLHIIWYPGETDFIL